MYLVQQSNLVNWFNLAQQPLLLLQINPGKWKKGFKKQKNRTNPLKSIANSREKEQLCIHLFKRHLLVVYYVLDFILSTHDSDIPVFK